MAEYLEIESLEWIDNIGYDVENIILIIREGNTDYVTASEYKNDNYSHKSYVMKILNEYSEDGWEVVNFTDTFNYLEKDTLQRRKCYLLRKSY